MIRQFMRLTGRPEAMVRMLLGHAVAGVFQGVAIGLLIPFLQAFFAGQPYATWLWAIVGVALASVLLSISSSFLSMAIACLDVCGTLVSQVTEQVYKLPLGWFSSPSVARVSKTVSRDVSFLSHMPSIALPFIASSCGSLVGIVGVTAVVDWRIALTMLVPMPVALWALRWMRRAVMREHQIHDGELRRLSHRIIEFSQLQAILRATDRCRDGWPALDEALASERDTMLKAGAAKAPAGSLFHTAVAGGMLAALGLSLWFILGGQLDAATFVALSLMAIRFAEPIGMLAFYVDALHESQVAMNAIDEIISAPLLTAPSPDEAARPKPPVDLTFDRVSFAYTGERSVLRDVSFTAPAGKMTAIVGPSGSGKSTVLRLAARFWDVDSGRVLVGGVPVQAITEEDLMSLTSMVFQDVYLFDTTIEDNVRIGRVGATDEDVRAAAQRASLTEVIDRLPDGWQTRVGEGGASLSGGERQRVALARAFLKDAPVLLFDEVTSALDGINEARVAASLLDLARGRTVLVVAHRLSTIRNADQIVVLTDSGVEAVGTHDTLYTASPTYRTFWDDQEAVSRWKISHA